MTTSICETVFLGYGNDKLDEQIKIEINKKAAEGWRFHSIIGEIKRTAGGHPGIILVFIK